MISAIPVVMAALAVAASGCERPPSQARDALQIAEPHLAKYIRYTAWLERVLEAETAEGAHADALAETLFAPVRLDGDVLDVELELPAEPPLTLRLRKQGSARPAANLLKRVVTGRHAGLGASRAHCVTRRSGAPAETPCVWLSRAGPEKGPRPAWVLSVAYRASPE